MTLALIALFAAFTAYMLYLMVSPLISQDDSARADLLSEDLRQSEELSSLKALHKASLRDLETDRELEKVTQEDYLQLKREHESRAVKAMRELDLLHGGRGWQARVDAALDARRAPPTAPSSLAHTQEQGDPVEVPPKATSSKTPSSKQAPEPSANAHACPSCSFSNNDPEARFCSRCGAPMPPLEVSHSPSEPSRSEVN